MQDKKKILIFIDLPIILRHFIANNTFSHLDKNYNLIYVFNQSKYDFKKNHIVNKFIDSNKIRVINMPNKRTGTWFWLYIITVIRQQKSSKGYRARLKVISLSIGKRNLFLARIVALPVIYHIFKFLFINFLGIHKGIKKLIETENPSLIIHPTVLSGSYINDLLRVFEFYQKKLPLIFLMNSWDNPSGKAFCTGSPSKLIVWGEQTKRHAIKFMRLKEKDIECFGAAQFEVYKKECKFSRKELSQLFNVNPNKKIIVYAGAGNGSYETKYLRLLDKYVNSKILSDCQILYRPHPWRGALGVGEKDFLSQKWDNIIMDPSMYDYYKNEINNPKGLPSLVDYEFSHKLLNLADAVISPLSTILIEAILNGKPILLFFPEGTDDNYKPANMNHFEELIQLNEVNVCYKEEDFLQSCLDLNSQIGDKRLSKKLIKESQYFINPSKKSYGDNLHKLVKGYIG